MTDAVNGNYSASYVYDAVGNRRESAINGAYTLHTYDDNDRLLSKGSELYSYDDNGNVVTKAAGFDISNYSYDAKNHLSGALLQKGGITTQAGYIYDVDGIRLVKIENGMPTQYLVDHNQDYAQVLKETNLVTGISLDYLYGDDLISQSQNALNDRYYLYDGLGSTRQLTDLSGVTTDAYDYEAFGSVLNQSGATTNNYLFTGEQFDLTLGQQYLRARYYDPGIGRFTQMDDWKGCIGDPIGLNKYLYGNSDPVNNIDPTGKFSMVQLGAGTAAVGILAVSAQQSAISFNTMAMSGYEKDKWSYGRGEPYPIPSSSPDPEKHCEIIWAKRAKDCKERAIGVRPCLLRAYVNYLGCKSMEKIEEAMRNIFDNNDLDGF